MFHILCGFLCYLSVARSWESSREFTFQFVCASLWALVFCCVSTLTTLILYVEPLAWELAHSSSPPVSSCPSLSLSAETLCAEGWKSDTASTNSTWVLSPVLKTTKETSPSGSPKASRPFAQRHIIPHLPPAAWNKVTASYDEQKPFPSSELGHRKWKLVCPGEGRLLFKHPVSVPLPMSDENKMESN